MMFYKDLQVLFHFFTVLLYVSGETLMKKNEKRTSLRNNYQMCLDTFKIQEDKIIRTQESLDMGAKYLKELEFNSREECLKFCCDTESCDVFIFEEKNPGSCYLFQCGPLHDFKCKFTSHANYSSAVRSSYNTQSNSQLEKESTISQQEHELKSLRKLADPAPIEYSFTESPMKLIVTLAPKLSLTTSPPIKQVCTKNQYECSLSGDCIAIYNVCDGIPQCTDGSDEATDVCPIEKPTSFPSIAQGVQPPLPYQQMVDRHKPYAPLYPHVSEVNSWKLPNLAQQMIPPQLLLYPARQMEGAPGYQWDYQPIYDRNKAIYNSYPEQSNLNPSEHQSHIFNHKGLGVIGEKESDGGTYMDAKHPYKTSYFLSSNRQNNQVYLSPSPISNVQQKQIMETEKDVIITTTPSCDTSHEQKDVSLKSQEIRKIDQKGEKHIVHGKEISQNILKNETLKFSHIQTKETKEHKSVIVIKHHSREHGRNTLMAEHLKQANENEVLRPRGAVISLALGLTITAITATLIACRLRVVRRRGRRHGLYAHDADYLVNGMYL
ncbi:uncharacterized protein LOC100642337 [Bombus terrestris]|uniref:Uncharacterized protein LOC100642337 n=1 Tax=Bombus terrestris TaxID=30195 RepID=A0A9B2JJV5_BOMTE|nr:uncharacterized protein LOC100642337 [Bombus terrestris]